MSAYAPWKLKRTRKGVRISRPSHNFMTETVTIDISTVATNRWARGLRKVVQRFERSHVRRIPLSRSLRTMTGVRGKGITHANYYGSVPQQSFHIIGIGETLFVVADLYNWTAIPISIDDLRGIATDLA